MSSEKPDPNINNPAEDEAKKLKAEEKKKAKEAAKAEKKAKMEQKNAKMVHNIRS